MGSDPSGVGQKLRLIRARSGARFHLLPELRHEAFTQGRTEVLAQEALVGRTGLENPTGRLALNGPPCPGNAVMEKPEGSRQGCRSEFERLLWHGRIEASATQRGTARLGQVERTTRRCLDVVSPVVAEAFNDPIGEQNEVPHARAFKFFAHLDRSAKDQLVNRVQMIVHGLPFEK